MHSKVMRNCPVRNSDFFLIDMLTILLTNVENPVQFMKHRLN